MISRISPKVTLELISRPIRYGNYSTTEGQLGCLREKNSSKLSHREGVSTYGECEESRK